MDNILSWLPVWLLVLIGIVLVGLVLFAAVSFLAFLIKVGVIVNEARKPPHVDTGDYHLSQGREVRSEGGHQRRQE